MSFRVIDGEFGKMLELDRAVDSIDIRSHVREKELIGVILHKNAIEAMAMESVNALAWARVLTISGKPDVDLSWVSKFEKLEVFIYSGEPGLSLDLSSCKSLREVNISWSDSLVGLDTLPNLRHIDIWDFPHPDFNQFPRIESVTSMVLRNPKLRSFSGLESFPNLKALTLGPCRLLTSIESIDRVSKLEQLSFEGCRKIVDFSVISRLKKLQALEFVSCGKIQSLGFLRSLPDLKAFSMLAETEVIDAEVGMLKDLQCYVIRPRKVYSPIIEDSKGEIPSDFFINARFH